MARVRVRLPPVPLSRLWAFYAMGSLFSAADTQWGDDTDARGQGGQGLNRAKVI